jgi:CheY-like chemotaxis protein
MIFEALPILLAEDNDDDVFILRRALKQAEVKNPLQLARDGQELMDYLSGAGAFAARRDYPMPFLLLLDLKLPLHNGLEVLQWMRRDPRFARVTVAVLTSSAEQRDLKSARELGARFYLVKPPKSQTLASMMALLRAEWTGDSAAEVAKLEGDLFDIAAATEGRTNRS